MQLLNVITSLLLATYFSGYVKPVSHQAAFMIGDVQETVLKQEYVIGDFNADQKADTLVLAFISLIDKRPITIDTTLSYDRLITTVAGKKPLLQLIAPGWHTLVLNPGNFYVLGLDLLQNIGNINKIPGDEIAVVLSGADWSSINVCHIYSYSKYGWKKIKSTEIREEDLPKIKSGEIKPWIR